MNIDHAFSVAAPADTVWALLTDLEQVAPCMPGAQLTGTEGEAHLGKVKVKVGPVTAEYAGRASFAEKDDAARHAVIAAKGKEARGSGTAQATIDVAVREEGAGSHVTVATDLRISGKLAQFGSGVIQEVSEKLLGQFVGCLEARLVAPEPGPVAAEPTAGAGDAPGTAPATAAPARAPEPEPAALDLVGVVGPALLKRAAPLLAGLALLAALLVVRRARRH